MRSLHPELIFALSLRILTQEASIPPWPIAFEPRLLLFILAYLLLGDISTNLSNSARLNVGLSLNIDFMAAYSSFWFLSVFLVFSSFAKTFTFSNLLLVRGGR